MHLPARAFRRRQLKSALSSVCGAWCVTNQAHPPPDPVEPLTQVELAEALRQETAVIMLIGKASSDDEFEPNTGMIANLYMLVDVRHATATVPEDLEREMAKIKATVGVESVNTLARGALMGGGAAMKHREILAAACGGTELMASYKSWDKDTRQQKFMVAAAAGFTSIVKQLRDEGGMDVNVVGRFGRNALMWAARGGHTSVAKVLLDSGATLEAVCEDGFTALMYSVVGGHMVGNGLLYLAMVIGLLHCVDNPRDLHRPQPLYHHSSRCGRY